MALVTIMALDTNTKPTLLKSEKIENLLNFDTLG